jgi:hypothetical protein
MTDVPFLSVANIAFFFLVRALLQKSSLQLCVGCVFAASAFLVRQIAIAIPLSLILYALLTPSYRSWKYILPPFTISIVLALIPLLFAQIFGLTSQYAGRTWVFDYWLHHYEHALPGILGTLIHVGLALIPIAIAHIASFYRLRLFWSSIAALLLLTGYSYFYSGQIPQPLEGMWRLNTLGHERHLLHGMPDRDFLPFWWNYPLFAISLISLAAVTAKLCELIRAHNATPFDLFAWYALIQLALMMALWLFGSDRYSIVLLPALILLTAGGYLRTTMAIPGAAILYAVALLVTWNETQTSRAVHDAVAWLRQKNIALADIDAGYVFNGWNLYAHPENLPPGAVPERDVPFVTSKEMKRYVIAASPIASYKVLREYSWSIPFRSLDYKVYVLEQLSEGSKNKK